MTRLPREVRQRFWEAVRSGLWAADAAVVAGVSRSTADRLVVERGGVMEPRGELSGRYLGPAEREEIAILHAQQMGVREIGRRIGRPHTTVSRELARNRNRDGSYRAGTAQTRAEQRGRRPKPGKLTLDPRLCDYAVEKLGTQQWSPKQISQALRVEFPDDPSMRCCHETIYRSLYVQGRGELRGELRRELAAHLRTGREARKPQHRPERRKGRLVDTIQISQRPAEAADRAVPGHWEGDLILGKAGGSAVGTLVERSTRFVLLVHLPERRTAEDFAEAAIPVLRTLPAPAAPVLTWDQGKEMAPTSGSGRDRRPGLLLRPALAVAARIQREHQRPATPVLPQERQPAPVHPRRPRRGRPQAQQPPPRDPRLGHPRPPTRRATLRPSHQPGGATTG